MKRWSFLIFFLAGIIISYPFLRIAILGTKLTTDAKRTLATVTTYTQTFFTASKEEQSSYVAQLLLDLEDLSKSLSNFNYRLHQSWLAKKLFFNYFSQLNTAQKIIPLTQDLLTGTHTYLFLFQNSEEIRATGGFLGSYAKLRLTNGLLDEFKIQDIYVPSGEFTGFIEPPTGAKEYLSGGESLKLQDANWHPDFPTSAQQILSFFALGSESEIEGVIAVNLPVVEDILEITGSIYIPDSQQTVNARNFSDVARVDRDQFFPGSQQKQHFLSTFFNQLSIKLSQLDPTQQKKLIQILIKNAQQKNFQFFSHQAKFQSFFENQQLAGQLLMHPQALSLMLVESNVGINKANQHLDRAVKIKIGPKKTALEVSFANHNQPPEKTTHETDEADHLTYVNYQRLILPPTATIEKIIFDNQEIKQWNQETITNSKGQNFTQVGFLIIIPEKQTKKLSVQIKHKPFHYPAAIWIQKQAGIPPTEYQVSYQQQSQSFSLIKDTLVEFTP